MNSYLAPLVQELHELWNGIVIPTTINGIDLQIRIRAALSCIACDIPASRKVCGFVGHNAKLGCNKCLKEFLIQENKTDYSGYDRENWAERSLATHRSQTAKILKEQTPTNVQRKESEYGIRYSILLQLPYFDPIKFTAIDPMHNLFLGTGKHAYKVWLDNDVISKQQLNQMELRIQEFCTPTGIGRLPYNISSGFGGFTANQWSNWITIYSPVVLKGILPDSHLRCWLLFVKACSILRKTTLKKQEVHAADLLLLHFCKKFEELYGKDACTPNMHLHNHLKDSVLDFGPPHSFWCYAFERFNGVLGSIHTNRHSIECQLMKRFCQQQDLTSLQLPTDEGFQQIFSKLKNRPASASVLGTSICSSNPDTCFFGFTSHSPLSTISNFSLPESQSVIKCLPPFQERVLTTLHAKHLKTVYEQLYPTSMIEHFPLFYKEYGRVNIAGDVIGSVKRGQNSQSSSVVMCLWPGSGCSISDDVIGDTMRVGVVQHFLVHNIHVITNGKKSCLTHAFCYIHWKKQHPNSNWYGASATVCTDLDEDCDACCFVPIQRIAARCAFVRLLVDFSPTYKETVFITCPIPLQYSY